MTGLSTGRPLTADSAFFPGHVIHLNWQQSHRDKYDRGIKIQKTLYVGKQAGKEET